MKDRNIKKIVVATAFVASTSLSTTMVNALGKSQIKKQDNISLISDIQTGWVQIGSDCYYYDTQGNYVTGIQEIDGEKYYFYNDGKLATVSAPDSVGTVRIDNILYAYYKDGKIIEEVEIKANQWIDFNGIRYYFDDNLNPYTGVQEIDGKKYYFYSNGELINSNPHYPLKTVIIVDKMLCFCNKEGEILDEKPIEANKWIEIGNSKYYFDKDLNPYHGVKEIDGEKYIFWNGRLSASNGTTRIGNNLISYSDGKVIEEVEIEGNKWIEIGNSKYYFDENLNPYHGVREIKGERYYFYADGMLSTCGIGYIQTVRIGNELYAYNHEGKVLDKKTIEGNRWIEIGNKKYYFDKDLKSYEGVCEIDGQKYYFLYGGQLATSNYQCVNVVSYNESLIAYDQDGKVIDSIDIKPNQWIEYRDGKYYFDSAYRMYTGVKEIDGKKYYFEWNGRLATYASTVVMDNVIYAYNQNGEVIDEKEVEVNKWNEIGNSKYYFDSAYRMYTGIKEIDGKKYYFYWDGRLSTGKGTDRIGNNLISYSNGKVIEDVKIETNKWISFNGYKYYYDEELNPYKGVHEIDGQEYYFYEWDGRLAQSNYDDIETVRIDNTLYAYDKNGKVIDKENIEIGKWIKFYDDTYYFNSLSEPLNGICKIDNQEYMFFDSVLSIRRNGVYVKDNKLIFFKNGKVVDKTEIEDGKVMYFHGNYYCYKIDGDNYSEVSGIVEYNGKEYYFIEGVLKNLDDKQYDTGYDDNYIFIYNNKGEIIYKVKKVKGWNYLKNNQYQIDETYYFDDSPYGISGIKEVDGQEYYFRNNVLVKSASGKTGTYIDDSSSVNGNCICYVDTYDENGKVIKKQKISKEGWLQTEDGLYYFNDDLSPASGMKTIDNVEYVFIRGELITAKNNNIEIDISYADNGFYIVAYDKDGIVKDKKRIKSLKSFKWTEFQGGKYYIIADGGGVYLSRGWKEIDDEWYHFTKDGKLTTGWLQEDENTWYYLGKEGQMTKGWLDLNGKKYYFNQEGKMVTGTVNIDGKDYTFNENGELTTGTTEKSGWIQEGNKWYYYDNNQKVTGYYTVENTKYYFDANGVMQTGWFKIDGVDYYAASSGAITAQWIKSTDTVKYYVDENGKMLTGTQTIGDQEYYFDAQGRLLTGWITENGKTSYYQENGKIHKGWLELDGKKYYFDQEGKMVTGTVNIDGKDYTFNEKGELYVSVKVEAKWKQSGNKWWYQYEDGTYPKNEFITIDNKLYRFDQYGYMQTGWFKINKEYYYAPSSGSIQEQWVKSGNNWYYVDADGKMVTGDYAINGEVNRFDANGIWLGQLKLCTKMG